MVESVINLIGLMAGEGPFPGEPALLSEAIQSFTRIQPEGGRASEPVDAVLATMLALSFCDVSTADDHAALCSQFHKLRMDLQCEMSTMLSERGLTQLVTPNDPEDVFARYERIFHRYVDDPLWPSFKFPLTHAEQIKVFNKLELRFTELQPLLDNTSLTLAYGGAGPELRQKMMQHVCAAAEQPLPEVAFLRTPPYPGISTMFQGRCGFTVVMRGSLYEEGNRPREVFKAMKYFHLGHRLEVVVRAERDRAVAQHQRSDAGEGS